MSIAFDEIIRNGVITLPQHLRTQAEGRPAHVFIPESVPEPQTENTGWDDIIERLMRNPLPPFTPLTREEANDRRL